MQDTSKQVCTNPERSWTILTAVNAGLFLVWLYVGGYRWEGYPCYVWPVSVWVRLGYFLVLLGAVIYFCRLLWNVVVEPDRFTNPAIVMGLTNFFLLRIILGSALPLLGDEAYHWLWPIRLDWAYYDHPGLLGWLGYPFSLISRSVMSARMGPILMGTGSAILMWYFARWLTGKRSVANVCLAGLMMLPIGLICTVILFTDSPLGLLWPASAWVMLIALEKNRLRWWLLQGLLLGLGINCKFLTFVLIGMMGLYLLIDRRGRRALLTAGPYFAIVLAMALSAPVIIWNALHQWQTFVFNFVTRPAHMKFSPYGVWIFAGQEMLLLGPVLLVWSVFFPAVWGWKAMRAGRLPAVLVVMTGYAPLLLYILMKPFSTVGAGWTAPLLPLLLLILAWSASESEQGQKWLRAGLKVGAITTCLVFAGLIGQFFLGPDAMRAMGSRIVPEKKMKQYLTWYFGWYPLGQELNQLYRQCNQNHPTFIMTRTYMYASQLTQYSRAIPLVFSIGNDSMYGRCFDYWNEPEKNKTADCIYVSDHNPSQRVMAPLQDAFGSVQKLSPAQRSSQHWISDFFQLYYCRNPKRFPQIMNLAKDTKTDASKLTPKGQP